HSATRLRASLRDPSIAVSAMISVENTYDLLDDDVPALEAARTAAQWAGELDYGEAAAIARYDIGSLFPKRNYFDLAIAEHRAAANELRRLGRTYVRALVLLDLGVLEYQTHRFADALATEREVLAIMPASAKIARASAIGVEAMALAHFGHT